MLFWILAIAIVLLVGVLFVLALTRRATETVPATAYDLQVYRDQLRDLERDLERGTIGAEAAERARIEISRKMLEVDRRATARGADPETAATRAPRAALIAGVAIVAAALAGAFAVYARLGAPGYPDQPVAQRLAEAEALYRDRPSQAEAEAQRDQSPRPQAEAAADPEMLALMDRLRAAVAETPDDPRGLALLARNEMRLGNYIAGHRAQARLVEAKGDAATAEDWADLGEFRTVAAHDIITPEAEAAFAEALARDADNGRARYYIGLMMWQNGRPDRAFAIWDDLLRGSGTGDPWVATIRQNMDMLAWLAGREGYTPPAADVRPADADLLARAARAPMPEAREQLLRAPLEALSANLAQGGGSDRDWAVMIGGARLLGEQERAAGIYGEARGIFAAQPEVLDLLDRAFAGTWPERGDDAALPGPAQADIDAASELSDADRAQMIEGMVARLTERLDTEGGSAEEWARAVRALAVMGQPEQAQAFLARGRAALAGDEAGLALLEAAAREAGIATETEE